MVIVEIANEGGDRRPTRGGAARCKRRNDLTNELLIARARDTVIAATRRADGGFPFTDDGRDAFGQRDAQRLNAKQQLCSSLAHMPRRRSESSLSLFIGVKQELTVEILEDSVDARVPAAIKLEGRKALRIVLKRRHFAARGDESGEHRVRSRGRRFAFAKQKQIPLEQRDEKRAARLSINDIAREVGAGRRAGEEGDNGGGLEGRLPST